VILEPVNFVEPDPAFLEELKDLCQRNGALLVFDEIITGFRLHLGGAQALFRVTPDLACFGKAMANGFPLSAIVGRAEVMRLFEQVFFSFTFGGEAISLAAGLATIRALQSRNGIDSLWTSGARLQVGTREILKGTGLDAYIECAGLPPWTTLRTIDPDETDSLLLRSLFQQEAIQRGLLTHGNHMLSVAHDEAVIDSTLAAYWQIFPTLVEALQTGEVAKRLKGPPMQRIIR
jgi:glutamate-1-semialdehyde 2,1-aminomutase/spore coat polysaccharide biosynthesis protein SpsF